MTQLDDLYQNVLDKVKRPDKEAAIKRGIRNALIYYHTKEQYGKDLIEVPHIFMNSGVEYSGIIQRINKQDYPRLRKVKYIALGNSSFPSNQTAWLPALQTYVGQLGNVDYFEEVAVDRVLDGYSFNKGNVWYEAADNINLNGCTAFSRIMLGYYAYPILFPDAALSSWIGAQFPDLIAYRVARQVFKDIGKIEEANGYTKVEIPEQELLFLSAQVLIK